MCIEKLTDIGGIHHNVMGYTEGSLCTSLRKERRSDMLQKTVGERIGQRLTALWDWMDHMKENNPGRYKLIMNSLLALAFIAYYGIIIIAMSGGDD